MTTSPVSAIPPKQSGYRPILLTLLFSILLGGGSCYGFLSTFNGSSPLNNFFAAGFVLCLLVFLSALVWMIVKAVRDKLKGGGGAQ